MFFLRRQDDTAFKIHLLIAPIIFHTHNTHTHTHTTRAHTHTHTCCIASLSQPNVACPIQHVDNRAREPANGARAARPPDAEILSVWEDGYMRGQGCEECAEVCLYFFVVCKAYKAKSHSVHAGGSLPLLRIILDFATRKR